MDLKGSMELAGRNLVANLCPARNYLPYWAIEIDARYGAWARFTWPQHNVGRWWDAMLRLEAATGFRIPPDREAAMLGNLHSFEFWVFPQVIRRSRPPFARVRLTEGNDLCRARRETGRPPTVQNGRSVLLLQESEGEETGVLQVELQLDDLTLQAAQLAAAVPGGDPGSRADQDGDLAQ